MALTKVSGPMTTAGTVNVLDFMTPAEITAVKTNTWTDVTDVTDVTDAVQAALDNLNTAGGGTLHLPEGTYVITKPLTMYSKTRLIGAGKGITTIKKTTSTTVATSLTSNLVCLDVTPIGAACNCILYVYDAIRAGEVEIAHITFTTNSTNATGSPVKYGIVAVGLSESSIHDTTVSYVSSAQFVTPVIFLSDLFNNTAFQCGQGLSIESGTSLSISSNYSSRCQKYGYYFRDVKYSSIRANACDSVNDDSLCPDYTDRTVDSVCYMFNACYSLDISANGAEGCFGTQFKLDSCIAINVKNNVLIDPRSSYTGANQVAIFYLGTTADSVCIENNFVLNGVTALQGGAVAGQHHDFYSTCANNLGFKYTNNWLSTDRYGTPSAVYGNNVPSYLDSSYQGAQLHGEFTPTISLLSATGVSITYGTDNKGRYSVINGWMFVDIQIHLSTVTYTAAGAVYVSLEGLPIANKASSRAPLLIDSSSNITWPSTESFWAAIDSMFKTGLIINRTNTAALRADSSAFASGATDVKFHCTGQIYVGDQVNIV